MHNELTASASAAAIAAGEITSERLVRDCLDRIEAREPTLHAWAWLDPEHALAQARALDKAGDRRGPLHGVPVGVKDIIDTFDMPTQMGSPIYDGHRTPNDAACVALLRAAGAVILGKTATVELAGMAPAPTCNPHSPAHTTGGSSSGSAAAVADFMVPVAFGTQTAGSVHRPAAYCGVVGYKPTYGTFNLLGVHPAAWSLDTLGLLARSLEDIELCSALLVGRAPRPLDAPVDPPRIGLCRTHLWDSAKPETRQALAACAEALEAAGAEVIPFELPGEFAKLTPTRDLISNYERARATAWEWHHRRDRLSEPLRRAVERGFGIAHDDYLAAQRFAADCRTRLPGLLEGVDALIAPCTEGEAPADLDAMGDHAFVSFWNLLHVPSFALPTHSGPNGMPVAVHLVGTPGGDAKLSLIARRVMERVPHRSRAN